jgi:hypothetical protein
VQTPYPQRAPAAARRPPPALVAGAVVAGLVFAALGPASCALSCFSAPAKAHEIFSTCANGDVAACTAVTDSQYFGEAFAHDLPAVAERCGAPVEFATHGVSINLDAPYDWKAELTVTPSAGECELPPLELDFVGYPWKWKLNNVGASKH